MRSFPAFRSRHVSDLLCFLADTRKSQSRKPLVIKQSTGTQSKYRSLAHRLHQFRHLPRPSPDTAPPTSRSTSLPRIDAFLGNRTQSPTETTKNSTTSSVVEPKQDAHSEHQELTECNTNAPNPPVGHHAAQRSVGEDSLQANNKPRRNKSPSDQESKGKLAEYSGRKTSSETVQLPQNSFFPPVEETDTAKLFRSSNTRAPRATTMSESKILESIGGDYSRRLPQELNRVEGGLTASEGAQLVLARRRDIGVQGRNTVLKVVKSVSEVKGGKRNEARHEPRSGQR